MRRPSILFSLAASCVSAQALACPDCSTARLVRAPLVDADFFPNLALLLAPLGVVALICARLYRIGLERKP